MNDLTPIPAGIVLCTSCGARLSSPRPLPPNVAPLCTDCSEEKAPTRRITIAPQGTWVSIDESPPRAARRFLWVAAAAVVLALAGVIAIRPARKPVVAPPVVSSPAPEVEVPAEDGSRKALEAKKEAEALRLRRIADLKEELAALDQETAGFEAAEEFKRVLDLLSRAADRHEEALWVEGVGEREGAVKSKAEAQFAAIRDIAGETRDAAEQVKLRERVARWGLAKYAEELEKSLGAVPPPPPPPKSKEAVAYVEDWERAMARAAGRDYDRALPDLRRAAKTVREEEMRREAASDLDDLEKVKLLVEEIGRRLEALPRGTPVTLEAAGGKVAGALVQGDSDRVELRVAGARETVFVELADATSSSLAALFRGKLDARMLAIFCLLEGHSDAAKSHLARLDDAPAKYWGWAVVARSRAQPPEVDPDTRRREGNARDLYVAAEREFRSMASRGMAVQRYRSLAKDYADTTLYRHASKRISKRTEGCSDYFFGASEMIAGGTFRKASRPAVGACWASASESDFTRGNENFVEFEIGVMEAETYRCWVQVGGCCAETFQAFFQVTDLLVPHPLRPKERARAEPGSLFAVAIALPAVTPPATHAVHGGPKEPALWGWIEVALPRFQTPGAKRIRLVTAQQGFAVARAVVSTTRAVAPRDSELKALEEGREPEPGALPAAPGEPGLAAWWSFDDGAADLSGNGHDATLPLDAGWEPGKSGNALSLKGGAGATVRDSANLRIEGDLTISLWVKFAAAPGERTLLVGKGGNYGVWLVPGGRIVFEQRDSAGRAVLTVAPAKALETGRWTHVGAIVRGGHGSVYLDGVPEAARGRTGTPATSDAPLTLGASLSGLLDELRIFSKALSSDDIARQAK